MDSWAKVMGDPLDIVRRPSYINSLNKGETVTSLLARRARDGVVGTKGLRGGAEIVDHLSFKAAWNRRRMNDMVLVVGPKTPVSMVLKPTLFSRDGHPLFSSEDEEDEDDSSAEHISIEEVGGESSEEEENSIMLEDYAQEYPDQERAEQNESTQDEALNVGNGEQEPSVMSSSCRPMKVQPLPRPSLQHGGCINTATWLTGGWKLSLQCASTNSNQIDFGRVGSCSTEECPSQLATAGDDRVVKFWDVSGAMGSTSLVPAGLLTHPAYEEPYPTEPHSSAMIKNWKEQYHKYNRDLSGSVIPLGTLKTGHRGNIFHVTPVPGQPGKVATCAADGYLLVSDVEHAIGPPSRSLIPSSTGEHEPRHRSRSNNGMESSSIVVSPEFAHDYAEIAGLTGLIRTGMCFSHMFISPNIGMLCSERGLHQFDLRLPPREQPRQSVLQEYSGNGLESVCKACSLWDSNGVAKDWDASSGETYIFAGGASGTVGLYDLRMRGDSTGGRVLQYYRPNVILESTTVSVSGLDVSKDGGELLVSYENDHIYSFNIKSSSWAESTDASGNNSVEMDSHANLVRCSSEVASYGGHLNRLTFLKGARYAGPKDEYICTGSDSGHAWIYERRTGGVVSLLKADRSTCNGVIPHPSLPLFVTYGIDCTAKLWRACTPLLKQSQDECGSKSQISHYQKSSIVRQWNTVQKYCLKFHSWSSDEARFPDSISHRIEEIQDEYGIDRSVPFFLQGLRGFGSQPGVQDWNMGDYKIANNLRSLPELLQLNYDTCAREASAEQDISVKSGLKAMAQRISVARLRHQSDRLGLLSDEAYPWIMNFKSCSSGSGEKEHLHVCDLIPDFPMDWMPYDAEMTPNPLPFDSFGKANSQNSLAPKRPWRSEQLHPDQDEMSQENPNFFENDGVTESRYSVNTPVKRSDETHAKILTPKLLSSSFEDEDSGRDKHDNRGTDKEHIPPATYSDERAWEILNETIAKIKEGGNDALHKGNPVLAAQRYDKGLKYCALAFMMFPYDNLHFLKSQQSKLAEWSGVQAEWTPLFKTMISIRLNLSLAMQKPLIADWEGAIEQAKLAIQEIKPFAKDKGKVISKHLSTKNALISVPEEVFVEAKELEAKAYYRWGNAQFGCKDFASAINSFDKSIRATKESSSGAMPEAIVVRRLSEAKRENARRKERYRKKLKFSLSSGSEVKKIDPSNNSGIA